MSKRILCLLLVLALSAGCLAGCGKTDDNNANSNISVQGNDADQPSGNAPADTDEGPFALNKDHIVLVTQGETWLLYEGSADPTKLVWSSEDETVATCFGGIVTAVSSGTTTVHADYDGQRYSCQVTCNLRFFSEEGDNRGQTGTQTGGSYGTDPDDPVQAPPSDLKVDSSFFDDAAFIGDSVTLKLSYYAASSGELGRAQFLTRGSYGVNHAVTDSMLLSYQGKEMKVEEAVKATGVSKVFIMLGMNDIALYGIDKTIENWKTLINRIQTNCPGVKIYVQSMTPIWTGGEVGDLTNANMDAYNAALKPAVEAAGCEFIDVAPYMKDSTGGLATVYCSDSFVHVTDEGSAAWIKVLKAYDY